MGILTDNMRGALLMATCMVAFTVNDAFMKSVLDNVPLFQALFLRGVFTSVLLLVLGIALRGLRMPRLPRDRWLIALRTLAELFGAFLFMSALSQMPLANVSAILQVLPLSVTLASAVVFAEPLGWRRLTAIGVGFCGVLLIVRPGTEGFNLYSLYAVGAVVAVTVRDLAARGLSRDVSSLSVALFTALGVGTAAGCAALFTPWVAISGRDLGLLGGATAFIIVGYLSSVMAMRVGEIGFIAPFRYASLIAALILGFVVFGEWPLPLTLLGAAIIVATGGFTLYREQKLSRVVRPRMP
ncbi:DMT family transporter [Oceaniglobus trochenteri]|uniref:DMT family transporter n=1 Tax=Oceaniglobus trochenteri TaxID=2763260 RepID=UPI001CFF8CE3|nr:DMT family transporter [Oceaniglobus trochenteri]